MGQMKNQYLEQLDAGDLDQPETITIYVMTMGGKPCNAYMDKAEADYEAWLCNQADAYSDSEDDAINIFAVTEVQLLT
jgi:hypothetical protein